MVERRTASSADTDTASFYRAYIACLNANDWPRLADFVGTDVHRNDHRLGVTEVWSVIDKAAIEAQLSRRLRAACLDLVGYPMTLP